MMINKRRDLLKIRVALSGISPPAWREILVPARYSFWDLRLAIQDAMLWLDYHLHEFHFGGVSRDEASHIDIVSDDASDDSLEVQPDLGILIIAFLSDSGGRKEYECDFGDGWIHEITRLSIDLGEKGHRYPKCIVGERPCPPEEFGRVNGYQSLLKSPFDPIHPEHESISYLIPSGWGRSCSSREKFASTIR